MNDHVCTPAKVRVGKKILVGLLLFPWSLVFIVGSLIEKGLHMFGICLGG